MNVTILELTLAHFFVALIMPFLLVGVINRTKSWWGARKGPGLFQSYHDMRRLLRKRTVFSNTATPLFRLGAYVVLICALIAMALVPLLGQFAPLSFAHDFVAAAYTLGLARIVLMLSAMDVGSPFEGMGAAREAMYGAFAEPALFLMLGALGAATGLSSFADMLGHVHNTVYYSWVVLPLTLALLILLQTEASRVPVDDPLTHLELTMIHEAMILEYSGRHLALIEWAASLKMFVYSCIGIALFVPFGIAQGGDALGLLLALPALAAKLAVGGFALAGIETVSAKMRIFRAPEFLGAAFLLAVLAMLVHFLLEG